MNYNTFSIVARCPSTGILGVAVSTAVPAVGSTCPHISPGVGAASTQAWVNPYLAIDALKRLQSGADATTALAEALSADDARDLRQIGLVDAAGRAAGWSGAACTPWFGHLTGDGWAIQGNMLTGPEVLDAMRDAFLGAAEAAFPERLVLALEAGQSAGGDKRGKQSAAVLVYGVEDYAAVDLRVDEHPYPVAELRRVWSVYQAQTMPFLQGMPRKGQPPQAAPDDVVAMLLRSPAERPGAVPAPDLWTDILGIDVPPQRRAELLAAFGAISAEIRRLRGLDLTDIHPAVVFRP
ncbi:MAG TPA: DUF1028 domain-containing protein [Acetobacteraceae bacterium]|jgi:uncharacterized Ntn-hydrolase superfamily protein|nr:DUF1028 domain-containing protein [Acetobacteraceae bacterium]